MEFTCLPLTIMQKPAQRFIIKTPAQVNCFAVPFSRKLKWSTESCPFLNRVAALREY